MQHLPGDEPGMGTGQPGHGVGYFVNGAATAHERPVERVVTGRCRGGFAVADRFNHARRHAVDRDALRRQFMRERAGHAHQARLGGDHVNPVGSRTRLR